MKKVLAVSLVLNGVLAVGLLWKEHVVHAGAGGGVPRGNGDVNGDGTYDISDCIYYLSWRFLGGPAPIPIECPPPKLPATGQTQCYDAAGNAIDCASAAFPGQDGFYQAGCPTAGRFVDNGDGTVTDHCTGLIWQKNTAPGKYTWQAALKYCVNLGNNWRLPNVRELQSIVDYGRVDSAIDPVFVAVPEAYWASTSDASALVDPSGRWVVHFVDGGVFGSRDARINTDNVYVRAVRNAP